jgi:hypothetical protein
MDWTSKDYPKWLEPVSAQQGRLDNRYFAQALVWQMSWPYARAFVGIKQNRRSKCGGGRN